MADFDLRDAGCESGFERSHSGAQADKEGLKPPLLNSEELWKGINTGKEIILTKGPISAECRKLEGSTYNISLRVIAAEVAYERAME
jgi:hypothetical protein